LERKELWRIALFEKRQQKTNGKSVALPAISPEECMKPSPLGQNSERGATVGGQSHLQYGRDGTYIREAACFIYRQFIAGDKKSEQ
jgi:hypothetical protein